MGFLKKIYTSFRILLHSLGYILLTGLIPQYMQVRRLDWFTIDIKLKLKEIPKS